MVTGFNIVHWDLWICHLVCSSLPGKWLWIFTVTVDNFSYSSASQGISGITNLWQLLHGADRVLLVQPDENNDIKIQHLVIPVSCIYMLTSNLRRVWGCLLFSFCIVYLGFLAVSWIFTCRLEDIWHSASLWLQVGVGMWLNTFVVYIAIVVKLIYMNVGI